MAYELKMGETVGDGARRIAIELIDDGIAWLEGPDVEQGVAVHEVRKDCKKLRGLLRLLRPAAPRLYAAENRFFRDMARSLSSARDAEAAIETYDALMEHFGERVDAASMAPIREALTQYGRTQAEDTGDLDQRLRSVRDALCDARERVERWELSSEVEAASGFGALGRGLRKTYKRGRQAMAEAYEKPGVEIFHEWRKQAKYHRYHLRLLRRVWPGSLKPAHNEAKALGDRLGDDHDLAVLQELLPQALVGEPGPARDRAFTALMAQRSEELRRAARWLGLRTYAETPKAFARRLGIYWDVAQREHRATHGG